MIELYYLLPVMGTVGFAILGYLVRYGIKYAGKWIADTLVGTLTRELKFLTEESIAMNNKMNIIGNDVHYLRNNGQETRIKLNLLDRSNLAMEDRLGEIGHRVGRLEIQAQKDNEPTLG